VFLLHERKGKERFFDQPFRNDWLEEERNTVSLTEKGRPDKNKITTASAPFQEKAIG